MMLKNVKLTSLDYANMNDAVFFITFIKNRHTYLLHIRLSEPRGVNFRSTRALNPYFMNLGTKSLRC